MSSTNRPTTAKFTFYDIRNNPWVRSESFCLPNSSEIKFQLMYRLNCNLSSPEGTFTTIYIYLESSDKEEVSVEYRLSIGRKKYAKTQEGEETFSIAKRMRYGALFNINQDYLLDPKNGLIISYADKDGKRVEQLTICCEIKELEIISNNKPSFVWPPNSFIPNLQTLFDSGKYSDAALVVDGQEFRVHKNILTARSKVFSAMFEHDCKEKKQNRVEITDIQLDVCQELLRYLYTGKVESLDKFAVELLVVSDMYALNELKIACGYYLKDNASIETVADILLLADLHQANYLKENCIDFILDNAKAVQSTSGWKLLSTKADLITELFVKQTDKQEESKKSLSNSEDEEVDCVSDEFDYFGLAGYQFQLDMASLLENEKFSDAILLVDGEELRVHKNILAAQSKVFADIFEHDQNRVELSDMSAEVCRRLLRYIYFDAFYSNYVDYKKLSIERKYARELFPLSEKYQLSGLKEKSEYKLSETLEIESVSSILLLADKHNAPYLKKKCIKFISANCRQVTQTEEWKILTKSKPELLVDLYERIAAKQWY